MKQIDLIDQHLSLLYKSFREASWLQKPRFMKLIDETLDLRLELTKELSDLETIFTTTKL